MFDADYLLGRVYSLAIYCGNSITGFAAITVVAFDPQAETVRVHCENGEREYWPITDLIAMINAGELVESDLPPFVLPAVTADRRSWKKGGS
jgi:hypothetical protein